MIRRDLGVAALFTLLAACGGSAEHAAPIDGASDALRSPLCAREGTSSVAGTGPAGSLDASHVYARAFSGFCPDELMLIVTIDDRLATPYLEGSGVIRAPVPSGNLGGAADWSGTFAAAISLPDGAAAATGTLEVTRATPGGGGPTRLQATARFADGSWHFTAAIDAPYCTVTICL